MRTCVIFGAADFDGLVRPLGPEDWILAADGGLRHTERLGLTPDGILGDFDSLGYVPTGSQVFPVEKDDTDLMLAARRGLQEGFRRFLCYGAVDGPRLDHMVAAFQTLQFLADRGAEAYLVGKNSLITVVKNGRLDFPVVPEGIVSVFCMGPDAKGVTLTGLQYPLEHGTLQSGFPLGVSNHFIGKPARIEVADGSLLVLWDRSIGFPADRRNGGTEQ